MPTSYTVYIPSKHSYISNLLRRISTLEVSEALNITSLLPASYSLLISFIIPFFAGISLA